MFRLTPAFWRFAYAVTWVCEKMGVAPAGRLEALRTQAMAVGSTRDGGREGIIYHKLYDGGTEDQGGRACGQQLVSS